MNIYKPMQGARPDGTYSELWLSHWSAVSVRRLRWRLARLAWKPKFSSSQHGTRQTSQPFVI
jgi:hypothetical protein